MKEKQQCQVAVTEATRWPQAHQCSRNATGTVVAIGRDAAENDTQFEVACCTQHRKDAEKKGKIVVFKEEKWRGTSEYFRVRKSDEGILTKRKEDLTWSLKNRIDILSRTKEHIGRGLIDNFDKLFRVVEGTSSYDERNEIFERLCEIRDTIASERASIAEVRAELTEVEAKLEAFKK